MMTAIKEPQEEANGVAATGGEPVEAEVSPDMAGNVASPEPSQAAVDSGEVDVEDLHQENQNLRQQVEEHQDKLLRTQAEMDNLRKRTSRDIENAHKYALDKFVKELLPVIDSMELGISASDENVADVESLREGMELTLKKFLDTLEKFGVKVIDPRQEKFDPDRHQAVTMQDDGMVESGLVTAVMQKGYELNGRLVRPAMVIVAK